MNRSLLFTSAICSFGMGTCIIACFCIFLFGTELCYGQAPQALNYQAIARDNQGSAISNQSISLRINILTGSNLGSSVYAETHATTTNDHGLFSLVIGSGSVVSGVFAQIDWAGAGKWMKVEMDPAGGSNYFVMGTSQLLSVPYALYAETTTDPLPSGNSGETMRHDGNTWIATSNLYNDGNNVGIGTTSPSQKLEVAGTIKMAGFEMTNGAQNAYVLTSNGSGIGTWQALPSSGVTLDQAYDFGGAGAGRTITADAGQVEINSGTSSATGFEVNSTGSNGIAIRADNTNSGVAIRAENSLSGNTFSAIQAQTNSSSDAVAAVVGNSTGDAHGVAGQVMASASAQQGVYGSNLRTNGGHGVRGVGFNGTVGETNYQQGNAIYGENFDQLGSGGNGIGVAGRGYYGVLGEDRYLGTIAGAYGVFSNGNFGASGTKSFRIDHPQDPANKYLLHFSIESPEVLNVYRGTTILDAQGESRVTLPAYFGDINRNFSYHLTPIGAFAPVFVKEKVLQNRFVIAGGQPGMEVSWCLYAERNDIYLQNRPHLREPEQVKTVRDRGKYQFPEDYGKGKEVGVFYQKGAKASLEQKPLRLR